MTTVRKVDVEGSSLAVHEIGEGDPVVFHPGLGYASWCWRKLIPLIATRYLTVSIDPRGAGLSDQPAGPYTIDRLAADVAGLLDGLGLPSAHLIGHSMGGYVVQALTTSRPEMVRSMILLATSPGGPGSDPVPEETRTAWKRAAHLPAEEFARRTFQYSFRPGWPQQFPQSYEEDLTERLRHPTIPGRWRDQYAACEAFLREGIPSASVSKPSLIIHGAHDRVVPVANAYLLAERIPHARLHVLQGVGHNLMLEEPDHLAALILDFLDAVEAS